MYLAIPVLRFAKTVLNPAKTLVILILNCYFNCYLYLKTVSEVKVVGSRSVFYTYMLVLFRTRYLYWVFICLSFLDRCVVPVVQIYFSHISHACHTLYFKVSQVIVPTYSYTCTIHSVKLNQQFYYFFGISLFTILYWC